MKIAFYDPPVVDKKSVRSAIPFHILLKPVGSGCNLKCDYCYYPQNNEQKAAPMIKDMLEPFIKNYIASQPIYTKEINFVWQGGEPLLAGLDFYKRAMSLQQKYVPQGVRIINTLQTNATLLTPAWCRFFKQHDFIIGVSLDGPEHIHNRYRHDRRGNNGSYLAVLQGIKLLQQFAIEFNILTVVHDGVAHLGKEIYLHLVELGAHYIQFQPLMLEGDAINQGFTLSANNWGQFLSSVYRQWQASAHIGKVFVMNIEQVYSQYFTHVSTSCVHSERCGTNMMMETKGEIYACDHQANKSHYLGKFNGQQGFSEFVTSAISLPFGQNKSRRKECQQCAVKMVCQGGCPAHVNLLGRNQLCEGYFAFFSLVLEPIRQYQRNAQGVQRWRNAMLK
ncbi:anaerobic sulfatase maturase [Providencia vermicola]|uniref:Anaerobic sulfatase maturase n=1 Tax=Providencia stuartii TaxID=588 RepID=A0AAI9MY41_PROST|nr:MULTISPECIES: anaerobic sulfatase maturase [Providencia]ELR5036955.1 anaerobic sulfatase maturase [Providencia stuartii]ELR5120438.1 anaerobic sulfatase maturase [Providencia stuartii]ELR5142984.1 anaerobic sulfatase maturase [Providencia stuartii]ELZ5938971.1 anaerobic sulfatase maturase [Providencia stuartii]MCK1144915.1 anaerobic sulfatase maturase [Providencia stuartii]